MQNWKEQVPVIIAVLIFGLLCVVGYCLIFVWEQAYYTQIDNTKVQALNTREYQYNLPVYSASGYASEMEFLAGRELREGAFLRLKVMFIRGVVSWEEIEYTELPQAVQEKYLAPDTATD